MHSKYLKHLWIKNEANLILIAMKKFNKAHKEIFEIFE